MACLRWRLTAKTRAPKQPSKQANSMNTQITISDAVVSKAGGVSGGSDGGGSTDDVVGDGGQTRGASSGGVGCATDIVVTIAVPRDSTGSPISTLRAVIVRLFSSR